MNEIEVFEQKCRDAWGSPLKKYDTLPDSQPTIPELLGKEFREISSNLKIHIAEKLIRQKFATGLIPGESSWFLRNFGMEIEWRRGIFDFNRLRPIQAAILFFDLCFPGKYESDYSKRNRKDHIIAGGSPVATLYLVSQLEYIFRTKSRYLNEEGEIVRVIPKQLASKVKLGNKEIRPEKSPNKKSRVNQINKAFILYLYKNRDPVACRLNQLEKKFSISEYFGTHRPRIMHGTYPDISILGFLSALIIAMFYYTEDVC